MQRASFEDHLRSPCGRGPVPEGALVGAAGGAACGDLVRIALVLEHGRVADASFDAQGCGATLACASACIELVDGRSALAAARMGPAQIIEALGGLAPSKRHAAELAADALHRALASHWRALVDRAPDAPAEHRRVLVALSGGVDSGVAALLARERGSEVIAVTLKLWADEITDDERSCCSPRAVLGARTLAHSLGLAHLTLDMESAFRDAVVQDFIVEYAGGRTPNPCVRCNGSVRFDAMLRLAGALGAGKLVTGHYARIERDSQGPLLVAAASEEKDQSYMLSALRPELLERIWFPLGELSKPQVRQIAREARLAVAEKRESQDLCFLAGTNRERFLARHGGVEQQPGEIVDQGGRVLGTHRGFTRYTVGQRRGLGLASAEPLYVLATDARTNRVLVGRRAQLATRDVTISAARLYRSADRVTQVKLRYRSAPFACRVRDVSRAGTHECLEIELADEALGVAAGQVASMLDHDGRIVGHGVIETPAAEVAAHK